MPSSRKKQFKPIEIRELVRGGRFCIASDRITVGGERVGYMYREAPDRDGDSGWRFFAGTETQAEVDDPDRVGAYSLNTIANYDPDIMAWLAAPTGKAFGRDRSSGAFVEERYASAEAHDGFTMADPYPAVHGEYQMTTEWRISVPGYFWRRFEDCSLVLWRPGVTVWVTVLGSVPEAATTRERLQWIREEASNERFDEREECDGELLRWSYRLDEHEQDGRAAALYAFVIGHARHVRLSIYFDREEDVEVARALWRNVR